MPKCSLSFSFIEIPLSFVMSSISPILNSIAVSKFHYIIFIIIKVRHSWRFAHIWLIITLRYFHFIIFISFFHLSPINWVIWIHKYISIY
jgi:hypothetical protein